jgi:lauroyl/myristoyl acyltransferase
MLASMCAEITFQGIRMEKVCIDLFLNYFWLFLLLPWRCLERPGRMTNLVFQFFKQIQAMDLHI